MSRHCKAVCICSRKRSSLSVDDSTARAIFVVDFLPVQMLPAMIFLFQQLECKRPNFYEQRFCIIEAGCFISCSVFFAIGLSFFIFYSFGKDRVGCLIEDEKRHKNPDPESDGAGSLPKKKKTENDPRKRQDLSKSNPPPSLNSTDPNQWENLFP